jgi:dTDP-4-dehydrorhamnose reductase
VKHVLLTGASGLVGGRLAEILEDGFEVVAARHVAPLAARPGTRTVPLDLLDPSSIDRALEETRADAVVHVAALADANVCEEQPALAQRLNVDAPGALARAAPAADCASSPSPPTRSFPATRRGSARRTRAGLS